MRLIKILLFVLIPFVTFSQNGLKRGFIAGSYTLPPPPTSPRDYYISSTGTGDGTTSSTPAPISVFQSAQLISLDNVFFKRGDTFYLNERDIHALANIDLDAYGTGANPIILGSAYIGDQTFIDNGDGTWYIPLATAPKGLVEGDVMLRQAETDWIPITVNVSAQVRRISTATLATLGDIIGCEMYVKEFEFRFSQKLTPTIADAGTGNITFTGSLTGAAVGFPIKFVGRKQFITSANDWAYDASTQRLYIKAASTPTGRNLRIINSDRAIHISNTNGCRIRNIDFKHYYQNPIFINESQNISVEKGHLSVIRGNGIRAFGNATTNLILDSLEIDNCGLRGVEIGGIQGATFTYLNIHDIGLQANLGFPFDINRTGGTGITLASAPSGYSWPINLPNNITIDHCTIANVGYQGVQCIGANWTMTKNVVHDYCLKWSDGGAFHLYWNSAVNGSTSGNLIQHNIIYNGVGSIEGITGFTVEIVAGVYFDSGIIDNTADNNVIYNAGVYAIWCNDHNKGHVFTNNIIHGSIYMRQNTTVSSSFPINDVINCTLTGNTIAIDASGARCIVLWNQTGGTWQPFTTISNNHYVSPYNLQGNINATSPNSFSFTNYTLSSWQTFVSGDVGSTSRFNYKTTPDSDDILIQTNATDNSVNFNTPAGYSDYNAGAFTNPVSITAWYGLIYFQN